MEKDLDIPFEIHGPPDFQKDDDNILILEEGKTNRDYLKSSESGASPAEIIDQKVESPEIKVTPFLL